MSSWHRMITSSEQTLFPGALLEYYKTECGRKKRRLCFLVHCYKTEYEEKKERQKKKGGWGGGGVTVSVAGRSFLHMPFLVILCLFVS